MLAICHAQVTMKSVWPSPRKGNLDFAMLTRELMRGLEQMRQNVAQTFMVGHNLEIIFGILDIEQLRFVGIFGRLYHSLAHKSVDRYFLDKFQTVCASHYSDAD